MKSLLSFLLLFSPSLHAAKPVPVSPRSFVHNEGVVSRSTAGELSRLLRGLRDKTGHQFVVALFQSLEGESLEEYSHRVAQTWKVGEAKKDDGLLFSFFLKDHRWRVEVGYGLEGTITDLEAAEIARDIGVPYFKAGDYDGGVMAVAQALCAKLGGGGSLPRRRGAGSPGFDPIWIWVAIILFIWMLHYIGGKSGRRSRYSRGRWSSDVDWSSGSGGGWSSGGGSDPGGFSGGGGSFGGGGASGSW